MNNKQLISISTATFLLGIIFLMYQKEWIILCIPNLKMKGLKNIEIQTQSTKKKIKFYFWKNCKWATENIEVIWTRDNEQENIKQIIVNWLNIIDEEKIIDHKVSLQHILNSLNSQDVYISFDRNLFNEESSTYNKLMLIESLLKTIRENDIKINKIHFFVHNQEMKDNHLDFSHAWPITGFLKNN